jgi:hypothetical protein
MPLQCACKLCVSGRGRGGMRDNDDIKAHEHRLMMPKRFSYLALDAVAHHGVGRDPARYSDAKAGVGGTNGGRH